MPCYLLQAFRLSFAKVRGIAGVAEGSVSNSYTMERLMNSAYRGFVHVSDTVGVVVRKALLGLLIEEIWTKKMLRSADVLCEVDGWNIQI